MVKQIPGTLTITIRKQDENYTIEAEGPKGIKVDPQPAPQLTTLPSNQEIADTLKELSNEEPSTTTEAIQKLGKTLYDALFTDQDNLINDILKAFYKAQGTASANSGVRLRLQIEPAELAVLPWETLYDGKNWLSAQSTMPLVRKLALSENRKPLQKLQIRGKLRILFVGASPEDLKKLEVEKTAKALKKLLDEPIKKNQIVFDELDISNIERLRQELLKDYHILYFAGHGSPKGIYLHHHREHQDAYLVSAKELADALKGKQTRLVFLAACETSKSSGESRLLRGFAQELAELSNLPAIVAMQYYFSDQQANPLTTHFFAALAAGCPVDVAMAETRSGLIKKGKVFRDVFSPVLYLQAEDGALFPKAKNWPAISLGVALLIAAIVGGGFARIAETNQRNSEINQAESLGRSALDLFNQGQELKAFVAVIKAEKILHKHNAFNSEVNDAFNTISTHITEYKSLEGHKQEVRSVSFSPDGKTLASGSVNDTIKLWNLETGKEILTLPGHKGDFISVSISPDGKTLAFGSADNTIKLWNLKTGKEIRTLTGHKQEVISVSISPDGKTLASFSSGDTVRVYSSDGTLLPGSYGGTVKIWNLETGKEIRAFGGDKFDIQTFSISPDGKTLACGVGSIHNSTVKLWNLETGKEIRTLLAGPIQIDSLSFSPDGKTLASSSNGTPTTINHTIKLWNLKTGKEIRTLHTGTISSNVSINPNGKTLAFSSDDGTISLWNLETGKKLRTLLGNERAVRSVSFSPDGKTLAAGGFGYYGINYGTIRLWNLETGKEFRTLTPKKVRFDRTGFSISRDGKTVASGSDDGTIKLWNLETGEEIRTLPTSQAVEEVLSVSISPDGKTVAAGSNASGSNDGKITLWNLETGEEIRTLTANNYKKSNIVKFDSISISPDGKTLASGSDFYGKFILWNLVTGEKIRTLKDNKWGNSNVSISPDGKTVAAGSNNGRDSTITIWNLETGKQIRTLTENDCLVKRVSFSPDSKTLAAGGNASSNNDGKITLWNLETGEKIRTLLGHGNSSIDALSFSPDGKTLASGGNDTSLWNLETGKEIRILSGYKGSFSLDGQTLAVINNDDTITLWYRNTGWDTDDLMGRSCDWIRNYLTHDPYYLTPNPYYTESDRHLCDGIGTQQRSPHPQ